MTKSTKKPAAKAPKMKAVKKDPILERLESLENEVRKLQDGPLKRVINIFRGNG